MNKQLKIGIGIDTGGTYTDAAVYDFNSKKILHASKALTTKNDLTIGITNAIDKIPDEFLAAAEMISLSTTLATNACVEDRGGYAKLIFFGGDERVVRELGGNYGLPALDSKDVIIRGCKTSFSGEIIEEPDWDLFGRELNIYSGCDGIGIIEMNAMKNGAVIEKRAREIVKTLGVPAVCGHELFSELNCLRRGSSTLLNARLFPVIKEFLTAVNKSLSARNINAPVVIVRSDGSVMSEKFSELRPVETLLCGPAASAIGGRLLAGCENGVIVDIGGTTTDIAIVTENAPVMAKGGISIGKWKTFVDGLYIKTIGLGGDSAVHYRDGAPRLEDYRVTPICAAASEYPVIKRNLKILKSEERKHTRFLYEHLALIKNISMRERYSDEEIRICEALAGGPLTVTEAAKAIGRDVYTLNVKQLVKDGIITVIGLTPTDVMHIRNDFNRYDAEASALAADIVSFNLNTSVGGLCDFVYGEVTRKLYLNIVKALLENKFERHAGGVDAETENFINDCYYETVNNLKEGNKINPLSVYFRSEYPLIGIGAPAGIFISKTAELLGTEAIIPKHYEVANALGAIIGGISAEATVEIKPVTSAAGITGYIVHGKTGAKKFRKINEAVAFAVKEAEDAAEKEARSRGAKGAVALSNSVTDQKANAKDSPVYLGTAVTARAVGSAGL